MTDLSEGTKAPSGERPKTTRTSLIAAAGLAAAATLSGCGLFAESRSVTYVVDVVSESDTETEVRVEYLTRQTGASGQETSGATESLVDGPLRFETLAQPDDEISISAEGVSDTVLSCAIRVGDSEVLDEQESSAEGEDVTCTTTAPAPED